MKKKMPWFSYNYSIIDNEWVKHKFSKMGQISFFLEFSPYLRRNTAPVIDHPSKKSASVNHYRCVDYCQILIKLCHLIYVWELLKTDNRVNIGGNRKIEFHVLIKLFFVKKKPHQRQVW